MSGLNGTLPTRFRNASLKDWPEDHQVRKAVDPLMQKAAAKGIRAIGGIIVQGSNGVGKSHMLCAISNDLLASGVLLKRPVYIPADMVADLYGDFDGYREQPWVETFKRASILIIDDLGKEDRATTQNSTWKRDVVTQRIGSLLRMRVQAVRPTLISTNLSDEQVLEQYGQSIHSLLHEVGDLWITLTGKDRRKGEA